MKIVDNDFLKRLSPSRKSSELMSLARKMEIGENIFIGRDEWLLSGLHTQPTSLVKEWSKSGQRVVKEVHLQVV